MTRICYIKSCKKDTFNQAGVSFHRLPFSNPQLLQKWLEKIGDNMKISKYALVCSKHFHEECFDMTGQIRRLKEGAYPTLFLDHPIKYDNVDDEKLNTSVVKTPHMPRPLKKRRLCEEFLEDNITQIKMIKHDHNYSVSPSTDFKSKYLELKKQLEKTRKKMKTLQGVNWRQRRKLKSFPDLLTKLRQNELISSNTSDVLESTIQGAPRELYGRFAASKYNKNKIYPPELRKFALTLNFLSTKAYEYVRQTFGKALPHRSTISRWYQHVDGRPGICTQALKAIQKHCEYQQTLGTLLFDEMSIRKHVDLCGDKNIGFVDFGIDNSMYNDLPLAGHVLVYMVVALNGRWKVPVSYYFIDTLNANERASVTLSVLESLNQISFPILSLTCDAPVAHLKMAEILGVSFNVKTFNTAIKNPFSNTDLYFMLDNCHVIKLMRNLFFEYKKLYDPNGTEINVKYIEALYQLQEKQGLKLGNKLTSSHIFWKQQPMKVKLAVQTLSTSVADAIDYCRDALGLSEFKFSEATTEFIRICDRLFDIFNTKNVLAKYSTAPLSQSNEHIWRPFLEKSFNYFTNIRVHNGKLGIESPRKAAFLGFLTLIKSVQLIFDATVKGEDAPLKYLLTYKCSQDHLELFFASIRSRNGYNNNPSAKQFVAAFKRLLVNHDLRHVATNCLALDNTNILNVSSYIDRSINSNNVSLGKFSSFNELFGPSAIQDHDYSNFLPQLSQYVEDVVEYIAGFLVRKLLKVINCNICGPALIADGCNKPNLITYKNKGGLIYPSEDVIRICKESEKVCLKIFFLTRDNPPCIGDIIFKICNAVFANLPHNLFPSLEQHFLDFEVFANNHIFELTKQIICCYTKTRLHHFNNVFNSKIKGQNVRHHLNKIVLFKHQ